MCINQKIQTVLQVWISSRSIWQEPEFTNRIFLVDDTEISVREIRTLIDDDEEANRD